MRYALVSVMMCEFLLECQKQQTRFHWDSKEKNKQTETSALFVLELSTRVTKWIVFNDANRLTWQAQANGMNKIGKRKLLRFDRRRHGRKSQTLRFVSDCDWFDQFFFSSQVQLIVHCNGNEREFHERKILTKIHLCFFFLFWMTNNFALKPLFRRL
jgi:hypothetical protein